MATGNENTTAASFAYLVPFVGLGAAGGFIRELNTKKFSWKELLVRGITGAFGAVLAGLYLKHTAYSIEMQYAFAGAIGATAPELMKAVQHWLIRKLGGDEHDLDEGNNNDVSKEMDTPDSPDRNPAADSVDTGASKESNGNDSSAQSSDTAGDE